MTELKSALKSMFPIRRVEDICEEHGVYWANEVLNQDGSVWLRTGCSRCAERKKQMTQQVIKNSPENEIETLRKIGVAEQDLPATFSSFRPHTTQLEQMMQAAYELVNFPSPTIVMMIGRSGIGKTHLAVSCLKNQIRKNVEVGYIKQTALIRQLKAAQCFKAKKDLIELHEVYSRLPFLVIDEVGRGTRGDYETIEFFDILADRLDNNVKTLLISNMSTTVFKEYFEDNLLSRIAKNGVVIAVNDAEDYRRKVVSVKNGARND